MTSIVMCILIVAALFSIVASVIGSMYAAYEFGQWTENKRQKKIECAKRMKYGIPKEE